MIARSFLSVFFASFFLLPAAAADLPVPGDEAADATKTSIAAKAATRTETFQASADWPAIDWQPARIVKGTALDFSGFLDAPAGKHGPVICRDGQFVFKDAPDQPVHFYGTTMSHALPFVDKPHAEQMSDYMAACGFNIVRFHCYTFADGVMKEKGSPEFTPASLDQWEYLISCLRQRGIYYTLPLNVGNLFKAGDITDVDEFKNREFRFEICGLLPISQDAQNWFKQYTRNLLCHVNPYTGLAMKDDPALVSIEVDNENGIFKTFGAMPEFVEIYRKKCHQYLAEKNGAEPTAEEVEKALPGYALDLQEKFYAMMRDYLRQMGVQKPLTDISNRINMAYAIPRSEFDYVDSHMYWDLYKTLPGMAPDAQGNQPYRVGGTNPNLTSWSGMAKNTGARIFGLPFACGEYNSDYPTPYWEFVGPAQAAEAALQGWSTLIRCGTLPAPDQFFNPNRIRRIETASSPVLMFSERIPTLLFAENDLKPHAPEVPLVLTPEYLRSHLDLKGGPLFPAEYTQLSFEYRVGMILLNGHEKLEGYPCFVAPTDMDLPPSLAGKTVLRADATLKQQVEKIVPPETSATSGWKLDPRAGTYSIVTPRSETFALPAEAGSAEGENVSISGNQNVAVCFAGSLDSQPLAECRRALVLYLTDVKNTGCTIDYEGKQGMVVRNLGTLPLLVQQGKIQMSFKAKGRPLPKIWALKYDGTRSVAITPQKTADGYSFEVQAVTNPQTFSAYELSWEP